MAAPTSYTEKALADYMHSELGSVAGVLGFTVGSADPGSYVEPVNETLLAYGASDIASASDIIKLRSLARVQAWKKAVKGLAMMIDFSADGGSYKRSQMQAQAKVALDDAINSAMVYDPNYVVTVTRAHPVNDPYRYISEDERTL